MIDARSSGQSFLSTHVEDLFPRSYAGLRAVRTPAAAAPAGAQTRSIMARRSSCACPGVATASIFQHRGVKRPLVNVRPPTHSAATSRTSVKIRSGQSMATQPLAARSTRSPPKSPFVDAPATPRPIQRTSLAQPLQRLAVRTPLQRLQNHHHLRSPTPAPTAANHAARRDPRTTRQETNLRRFSAKNRCTDPSRTRPPHKPARCPTVPDPASQCPAYPMIPHHTHDREHPDPNYSALS